MQTWRRASTMGMHCVRLKVGQGVAGGVAESGKGIIINDVQSSPQYKLKGKGRKGALLCVPQWSKAMQWAC